MASHEFLRNGPRSNEIKIFYYVDGEDQPYVAHTNIPIQQITLRDVKRIIDRYHYKFFFRNTDPELGVIKDEVSDDNATVPYCQKMMRIVVHLVSLEGSIRSESNSVGSGSTKGLLRSNRFQHQQQRPLRDPRAPFQEPHYATLGRGGPVRVPLPSTVSSYPNGNGRSYPNGGYETESASSVTQSSYSDSEFDGSSRVSSMTEATHVSKVKKKVRRKFKMPSVYRASSMSSIADTVVSDNVIRVSFDMDSGAFLGIRLPEMDASSYSDASLPGVQVASIMEDSIVHADGRIQAGDIILQVNGISLAGMKNEQAIQTLREAAKKQHINLVVKKAQFSSRPSSTSYTSASYHAPYLPPYQQESSASSASYMMDNIMESYQEPVKPIDPAAWAQQTTNFLNQYDVRAPSSLHLGNRIAPFATRGHGVDPSMELSTDSEMAMIVQQMRRDNSGLDIRDRMWLKIPIPQAFMGKDLVKWLKHNVKNITSSSEAKKFASRLLEKGFIQHTLQKKSFSEQAYYTFRSEPELVARDFGAMSVVDNSEVDYDEELMNLESVSQVAANRVLYSEPEFLPGLNMNRNMLPRKEHRNGSGHSSGGSGYGSDKQKKSAFSTATENSRQEIFNPPLQLPTFNPAPSAVDSYRDAVRNPFDPFSAHL